LALAPYITRKCRGGARAGEEKNMVACTPLYLKNNNNISLLLCIMKNITTISFILVIIVAYFYRLITSSYAIV
jgi:hypothetical protein